MVAVFSGPSGGSGGFRDQHLSPTHSCIWPRLFPLATPPPDTSHEATTSRIPKNTHATTTTITPRGQVMLLAMCFFATALFFLLLPFVYHVFSSILSLLITYHLFFAVFTSVCVNYHAILYFLKPINFSVDKHVICSTVLRFVQYFKSFFLYKNITNI